MRVLRARGVESEAQVPFAGLLELLRPALGALDRIPEPQAEALGGALALRPAAAQRPLRGRRRDPQPARGERRGARRSRCWSTTRTGSTARARRRCCSRSGGCWPTRSRSSSPSRGRAVAARRRRPADAAARRPRRRAAAALVGEDGCRPAATRPTAGNPLALLELAPEAARLPAPIDAPVPVVTSVARAFLRRAEALPEPTRHALVVAAASDTGELPRSGARPGVGPGARPGRGRGLVAVATARSSSATAGALGGLRRRGARGAARSPPGARASAAGPRGRPARLAPRARRGRARRDGRVGARAGGRARLRAQRLRRRRRRVRAGGASRRDPAPAALPGRRRRLARRPGRRAICVLVEARPPTPTCRSRSRSTTCAARSRRGAGR